MTELGWGNQPLGWKEWVDNDIKYIHRVSRETSVLLKFNMLNNNLEISATGDLEHHVREDMAIVANRFAPHIVGSGK